MAAKHQCDRPLVRYTKQMIWVPRPSAFLAGGGDFDVAEHVR
jgi:hypothetical protein